jgi:RHS repeat-associated protein
MQKPAGNGARTSCDAENRIIEVQQGSSSGPVLATYEYDADGQRVHRTGVTTDTCDTAGVRDYVYDNAGHWVLEVSSAGNECKSEIYAAGRHYVTDVHGNAYFDHSDWLGTVRVRNTFQYPNYFETCTSLPFGDALTCAGGDHSTIHFTAKDRDAESGLDNFGARYNASNFGRFMSPDWSDAPEAVPYADYENPSSLNLYAYVANNPLVATDADGHGCQNWTYTLSFGGKVIQSDGGGDTDCPGSALWDLLSNGANQTIGTAKQAVQAAWDFYRTSRVDPGCVAASTASGAALGASLGTDLGGAAGLSGGPVAVATVPLGALGGGLLGSAGGGAAGNLFGQIACRVGGGGGSGGGSGGGKWKLGSNKSASKWANQLRQRGWTEAQIDEAIQHGQQYPATNMINPANGATRFVNPTTGQSVVLDNVTGEVLHVGGPGFKY